MQKIIKAWFKNEHIIIHTVIHKYAMAHLQKLKVIPPPNKTNFISDVYKCLHQAARSTVGGNVVSMLH